MMICITATLWGCPVAQKKAKSQSVVLSPASEGIKAPTEYDPSKAVMFSAELSQYINVEDFVKKISLSKIEKIVVLDSKDKIFIDKWAAKYDQMLIEKIVLPDLNRVNIWIRDYGPFWVKDVRNTLRFLDFKYFRDGKPDIEDRVCSSYQCKTSIGSQKIDLTLEGGNLAISRLANRTFCLTSDEFTQYNKGGTSLELLKSATGCQEVIVFPSLPGETTRHVDIWLKPLQDGVIMVGEILEPSIEAAKSLGDSDEDDPPESYAELNKEYLDRAALHLTQKGFKVVRVPMPTPITHSMRYRSVDHIYRSYVNSLILNSQVYIPQYRKPDQVAQQKGLKEYPDEHLINEYERRVMKVYRDHGFNVNWIPADFLVTQGGSIHCVTMQVPK